MNPLKMTGRIFLSAILLALAIDGVAAQAPSGKDSKEILPGARRIYTFPFEVYEPPLLVETKAGPRLDVTVHSREPVKGTLLNFGEGQPAPKPLDVERILWDVPANKEVHRFSSKKGEPFFGAWRHSSDGKRFAQIEVGFGGMSSFNQIKLYDFATRKSELLPKKYFGDRAITAVNFTPDGAIVILGAWGQIDVEYYYCAVHDRGKEKPRQFFRLARPKATFLGPDAIAYVMCAEVSPDGSLIATCVEGAVTVHDLKTGKLVFQAPPLVSRNLNDLSQSGDTTTLAFAKSKDGQKLLAIDTGVVNKKDFVKARLFDLKTKKTIASTTIVEKAAKFQNNVHFAAEYKWPGPSNVYFNAKSEPRVVFDGKIHDAVSGKVLNQFDHASGAQIARDGQYMVRLIPSAKDKKKMGIEIWSLNADN